MEQLTLNEASIEKLYSDYGEPSVRRAMRNINRGSAALDEYSPGWANKIVPSTLDLSVAEFCVCGQVFGAQMAWSVPAQFRRFSKSLGFDDMRKPYINYGLLDDLWTPFVIARAKRGRRIEFSIPA